MQLENKQLNENTSDTRSSTLKEIFGRIECIFNKFPEDLRSENERLNEISERLSSSRFHLATLGQFKRGKSTLLNALLGERVLPSAVLPLTSIPTFITWYPERKITVNYKNGRSQEFSAATAEEASALLAKYVTEEGNPLNRLNVASVNLGHPSTLLQNGVVLIDTPGIGSTFEHNTEVTMKLLPQCDAALFLISADPPITQVEIEFLELIQPRVARLFFIINKIDYLNEDEQKSVVNFLENILREKLKTTGNAQIFSVSAKQGLDAKLNHNMDLWQTSGLAAIEKHLLNFLVEQKSHTLNLALTIKARDIVNDSIMHLQLQQKSLSLPVEDLEARIKTFNQKLKEAEQKRTIFKDLLAGEQKRTIELINEQAGDLYKIYYKQLYDELDRMIHASKNLSSVEKEARQYITNYIPQVFDRVINQKAIEMEEHFNRVINLYRQQLFDLVDEVRKTAADIFDIQYIGTGGEDFFELKHEPFWVTDEWRVNWSPLPENFMENLLPANVRIKRIKKRLSEDIDAIISLNVGNLRWSLVCNITDSFYIFTQEIDKQIQAAIESTTNAISAAQKKRLDKSIDIQPELNKLNDALQELGKIRSELSKLYQALSRPENL